MKLDKLPKITQKSKKRLGQGHGSGRGKTSGRGTKGQKARGKIPLSFEGGALPLIKRLPFLKGKGKNYSLRKDPAIINLDALNSFSPNKIVTVDSLIDKGLVDKKAKKYGVKILGAGEVKVALKVKVAASKSAVVKIEKAGGTVESS